METIFLSLTLAITVEAIVEYTKSIIKTFSEKNIKTAVTQLIAIAVAMFMCTMTGADIFGYLNVNFAYPIIGQLLTGLVASRGANYVSDFIKKIGTIKPTE